MWTLDGGEVGGVVVLGCHSDSNASQEVGNLGCAFILNLSN